jgi:pheromone shutdown-related protein TraB
MTDHAEPAADKPPADATAAPASVIADQPLARITRDGIEYTVLGTAHVSRVSIAAVRELLHTQTFDAVAVELCESRYQALCDPEAWRNLDLLQIIRRGKAGMVAANLALSAFQRRLADQFGIEPGAEMKAAVELAKASQLPVWLIDRDVGVTLRRAYRGVRLRDRIGILSGLIGSVFERGEISEDDIEKLKQGDMLQSAFSEFAEQSEPLYRALIGERDRYMSARLREEGAAGSARRVLVVIGAGHLAGIEREIAAQTEAAAGIVAELRQPPPPARWPKWIGIGVLVLSFGAIGYAFTRGVGFGALALRDWILFTGCLAAAGAAVGGGHLLSILTAFVVAPLKPLRPLVPSGAFSAAVEMWLHRPRVADFESLRDDVLDWRGWWRNRVSRTLLVFMCTNIGMMIGEYLAGIRILHRLM